MVGLINCLYSMGGWGKILWDLPSLMIMRSVEWVFRAWQLRECCAGCRRSVTRIEESIVNSLSINLIISSTSYRSSSTCRVEGTGFPHVVSDTYIDHRLPINQNTITIAYVVSICQLWLSMCSLYISVLRLMRCQISIIAVVCCRYLSLRWKWHLLWNVFFILLLLWDICLLRSHLVSNELQVIGSILCQTLLGCNPLSWVLLWTIVNYRRHMYFKISSRVNSGIVGHQTSRILLNLKRILFLLLPRA
jgi:hypothetical protein